MEAHYYSGEQSSRNVPEGDVSLPEKTLSPCHISITANMKLH